MDNSDATGEEAAAVQILKRAVELDQEKKYSEAVTCYEQGITLLMRVVKGTNSEEKKKHFRKRIEDYLSRAELMKKAADRQKSAAKFHKQISISPGDTGYSYDTVFSPFIDDLLECATVEDAYIRVNHQISNFLRFCELLVKKATNLKKIVLHTTPDTDNPKLQNERLQDMGSSLQARNVTLEVNFSDTLHDREIRLDNGWIVKIGRGLDYFRRSDKTFSIGQLDMDLRACHETTIDIFPLSSVRKMSIP